MIKQELTVQRVRRIFFSAQFMSILSEVIKIEHIHEMDVNFKVPEINNFSGRIKKDADSIIMHLCTHPKFSLKNNDKEFSESYAVEIHRLFRLLMGLDIEQLRDLTNGFEKLAQEGITDETTLV